MTKEQSDYHRLENETKGEGSQGEPNEWAGGTPSPAQQIPWSEVSLEIAHGGLGLIIIMSLPDFQASYIIDRGPLKDDEHDQKTHHRRYR